MIKYNNIKYKSFKQFVARTKNTEIDLARLEDKLHVVTLAYSATKGMALTVVDAEYLLGIILLSTDKKQKDKLRKFLKANDKFNSINYEKLKSMKPNPYDPVYVALRDCITIKEAETHIELHKEETAGSLKSFSRRYGEKLGAIKFKEFSAKSAHSEETYIAKYGKNIGKEEYSNYLLMKDSNSLHFFIRKYGDQEGKRRYEANIKTKAYRNSMDFYILEYGKTEGASRYKAKCKSQGKDAQYYIDSYGQKYWDKLLKLKLSYLGFGSTFESLEGFSAYAVKVRNITKRHKNLKYIPNFRLRGKDYHIDHMRSIYHCYVDNIPEHIAGNLCNIEIIPARDNMKKRIASTLTKEELLERYHHEDNKHNR